MSLAEAAQLKLLDPKKLSFFKTDARLRMTIEGEITYLKVIVLRAFPLSNPQKYYCVRDAANKEVGLIVDPSKLDSEGRRLVEEDVERRYLVSVIKRIVAVKERFGTVEWHVETNRGTVKFTTREVRENVVRPAPGRYVFSDVESNRYDIPNLADLDLVSQSYLMRYV